MNQKYCLTNARNDFKSRVLDLKFSSENKNALKDIRNKGSIREIFV